MLDFFIDNLAIFMFFTLAILLFSGYPVAIIIGGTGLFYGFIGAAFDVFSVGEFFNVLVRVWGTAAESLILVAVPMFIFMGTMLERSGVAEDLLFALQVLLRKIPGGLAISITVMGTIMAATTGIIGASVVMMTMLALPTMLERGFSKSLATATIASSGSLGILIPPSIMLVVMGEMLSVSVGELFFGALIPGLILSLLYMTYICVFAFIKPEVAPPLPEGMGPEGRLETFVLVVKSLVPPTFLMFLVLGSIFFGWATPTEAAGVGAAGAIFLTLLKGRLKLPLLNDTLQRSTLTVAMVFLVIMGASAFSYVFRSLGGDDIIISFVEHIPGGAWGVLVVLMLIIFILGFFFEWIEITLIMLPIMYPILMQVDFGTHLNPEKVIIWFAILVAVNLQTSFLTPPFGMALFFLKGVAPSDVRMEDIYRGITPFIVLQLIALTLIIVFPQLVLWLPSILID